MEGTRTNKWGSNHKEKARRGEYKNVTLGADTEQMILLTLNVGRNMVGVFLNAVKVRKFIRPLRRGRPASLLRPGNFPRSITFCMDADLCFRKTLHNALVCFKWYKATQHYGFRGKYSLTLQVVYLSYLINWNAADYTIPTTAVNIEIITHTHTHTHTKEVKLSP
jgi:hypothetical protein